jgi:hypothetical protein
VTPRLTAVSGHENNMIYLIRHGETGILQADIKVSWIRL